MSGPLATPACRKVAREMEEIRQSMLRREAPTTPTLTAADRCIRWGVQAYVKVTKGQFELLWCSHHFNEHELRLMAEDYVVMADDRHLLAVRP